MSADGRRERYIRAQVYDVAPRFSENGGAGLQFDEKSCNWVIINKYVLPAGRWQQATSPMLIVFPPQYPDVPPIGFYLSSKLRASGGPKKHFVGQGHYGAPDYRDKGWWWWCVYPRTSVRGGWRPSSDLLASDNLRTFLNMAREALTSDE